MTTVANVENFSYGLILDQIRKNISVSENVIIAPGVLLCPTEAGCVVNVDVFDGANTCDGRGHGVRNLCPEQPAQFVCECGADEMCECVGVRVKTTNIPLIKSLFIKRAVAQLTENQKAPKMKLGDSLNLAKNFDKYHGLPNPRRVEFCNVCGITHVAIHYNHAAFDEDEKTE